MATRPGAQELYGAAGDGEDTGTHRIYVEEREAVAELKEQQKTFLKVRIRGR